MKFDLVLNFVKKESKYLFTIWFFLIIVTSSIPHLPTPNIKTFGSQIRMDYFIHFLEFFILSIFFMLWQGQKKKIKTFQFLVICIFFGLGLSFIVEIYQEFIPGRKFNIIDSFYNSIGFSVGVLCGFFLEGQKNEE